MKPKLLLLSLLVLSIHILHAQNKTVSGTVTDAATSQPLAGVSITVPGSATGTTTGVSGNFSLQVPAAATELTVSLVGYKLQTIIIAEGPLTIKLVADAKGLDEVVVVGYGTQKKKDLTGAVGTVSGKDIAGRQTIQISEALQGSVAGVTVTRGSGAPGAGGTIRVRGVTTTGENSPLILVDGIPVSSIDNVNPMDVENISVLKDASSAAIYGSRAAAGVILVTTKRGRTGQAELEYNYEYGVQRPTSLPEYVGVIDYFNYFNERATNDGSSAPYAQAYIDGYLDSVRANPNYWFNTDWQDLTMQRMAAPRQRHDLTLAVGTEKLRTKISIGYQNAGAFYDNYNYERYLLRMNNDLQISQKLSASFDIAYKRTGTENTTVNPIYEGRVLSPNFGAYYSDGRFAPGKDGRNPMAAIRDGGFDNGLQNQIMGRMALHLKPVKGLTVSAIFSPTFDFNRSKNYSRRIEYTDFGDPSRIIANNSRPTTNLSESRTEYRAFNGQLLANYTTTIADDHNVEALAGYEENYNFYEGIGASRNGFALLGYPYLNVGSQLLRDNSGSSSESALRSLFGRVSYNYKKRYFVQGNIRNDKSSRFGANYRDAVFPSFSAGWVVTEESFMEGAGKWLSFLKIRGSFGEIGNERIGNYPYQASLSPSTALFYQGAPVVPLNGYAQVDFNIADITWETTRTAGIGLDMAFFNNRLNVTADWFNKRTRDILLTRDIPDYVGYLNPTDNLGVIGAKGFEFEAGWRDHFGGLNYSIAVNLSDAKTKVITISNISSLESIVNIEGEEFNSWYGYKSQGLFQTAEEVANSPKFPNSRPGDVKYMDMDGDGIISSVADRVILGGSLPRYTYGGNIRLDYRNFDFGLVFQGVAKKLSLMPAEQIQPFAEDFGNMPKGMVGKFWSANKSAEENANAVFPRLSRASNANNYAVSDFFLTSGAYFRMKNISLGYTLKPSLLKKAGIKSLRFYAAVNDLFTIDKFPDFLDVDPEAASYGYPIVTTFMGGVIIRL